MTRALQKKAPTTLAKSKAWECGECGCTDALPCKPGCVWARRDLCSACLPVPDVMLARAKDQRSVMVWVMQALRDLKQDGTSNVFTTLDGVPVCITIRKGHRQNLKALPPKRPGR